MGLSGRRGPSSWLIDKSAYVRMGSSLDEPEWTVRAQRGLVRVSSATLLEIGYSARSGSDWTEILTTPPLSLLPRAYLTPAIEDRAMAVQSALAQRGRHRAPSAPDLLIAATGELLGLVVLHDDKDFDLIAEVTGQPMERLRY